MAADPVVAPTDVESQPSSSMHAAPVNLSCPSAAAIAPGSISPLPRSSVAGAALTSVVPQQTPSLSAAIQQNPASAPQVLSPISTLTPS